MCVTESIPCDLSSFVRAIPSLSLGSSVLFCLLFSTSVLLCSVLLSPQKSHQAAPFLFCSAIFTRGKSEKCLRPRLKTMQYSWAGLSVGVMSFTFSWTINGCCPPCGVSALKWGQHSSTQRLISPAVMTRQRLTLNIIHTESPFCGVFSSWLTSDRKSLWTISHSGSLGFPFGTHVLYVFFKLQRWSIIGSPEAPDRFSHRVYYQIYTYGNYIFGLFSFSYSWKYPTTLLWLAPVKNAGSRTPTHPLTAIYLHSSLLFWYFQVSSLNGSEKPFGQQSDRIMWKE